MKTSIECTNCEVHYSITAKHEPQFCSFCGEQIKLYQKESRMKDEDLELDESVVDDDEDLDEEVDLDEEFFDDDDDYEDEDDDEDDD